MKTLTKILIAVAVILGIGLAYSTPIYAQQQVSRQEMEKYAERGGVITHVDPEGRVTYEGHPDAIATHKKLQAVTYIDSEGNKHGFGDNQGNLITKEAYIEKVNRETEHLNNWHLQHLQHNRSDKEKALKKGDNGYIAQELLDANDQEIIKGCEITKEQAKKTTDFVESVQPAFTSFESQ